MKCSTGKILKIEMSDGDFYILEAALDVLLINNEDGFRLTREFFYSKLDDDHARVIMSFLKSINP